MKKGFRFDPAKVSAMAAAVGEMPPYCSQAQYSFERIGEEINRLYAVVHEAVCEALARSEKALSEAKEASKEMERRAANCESNREHIDNMASRSRATEKEKKALAEERSKVEEERVKNLHKAQRIRAVEGEIEGVRRQLLADKNRLEEAYAGLPERIESTNEWIEKVGRVFADLDSTLHEVDRLAAGLSDDQLHAPGGYYPRAARMRVETRARSGAVAAPMGAASMPTPTASSDFVKATVGDYVSVEARSWEDVEAKLREEGMPKLVQMRARTYAKLGAKRLLDAMEALGYQVQRDQAGNAVGADNYIRWERNDG